MLNINEIINKISEITQSGLPFMDGKELLAVEGAVLDTPLTVDDYGYLNGEKGEFVVIALKEYPNNFIFGGSVVTEAFKKLDEKIECEDIEKIIEHGLTFKLTKEKSKNKREYTRIEFFPLG